ncbi:MAG: hypothetical protein GY869_27205, partial [Planctomycetes bacterium]|nr:hypothetical protein [Planctomycetota bacterium]
MLKSSCVRWMLGLALAIISILSVTSAQADDTGDSFTPIFQPELEITRTSGEIKIDGQLRDPGWQSSALADNFVEHQPGDQTKPPVETVARITYDQNKLYVSFICYDDPLAVRASHAGREGVYDDDNIVLLLDTYGDAAWAYTMNVNPYGVQADALWSPNT